MGYLQDVVVDGSSKPKIERRESVASYY